MNTAAPRLRSLRQRIKEHGVQLSDVTVAEALDPYLNSEETLPRYAALSHTEERFYITPGETLSGCMAYLQAKAADDVYPEAPSGVIDLDTNELIAVRVGITSTTGPEATIYRADDGAWVVDIDTLPMGEAKHLPNGSPNLRVWVNDALVNDGPFSEDFSGLRRRGRPDCAS